MTSRPLAPIVMPPIVLMLLALALIRPIDHDESQYVAAAALTAKGLLPYRDFAYLQTPLQPFLFAPVAALFGDWCWPALRAVNAGLAACAIFCVHRAALRSGVGERAAITAAIAFAACDILLFSAAMARNDALPAALLAGALVAMTGPPPTRGRAFVAGLLLAGAAAAKISYALPAAAYGIWALFHREHRPGWVALGAAGPALFVAATWLLAPADFVFGVFTFPARAPAEFYADRPWKLSLAAKLIDTLKFLALGPALVAAAYATRHRAGDGRLMTVLAAAGLAAALLPAPTWRQYLLPILPPLFVRLALAVQDRTPPRGWRIVAAVFVVAGLAPTIEALANGRPAMAGAMRERAEIGRALASTGVTGPVATLSPQFVPVGSAAIDPRFAAGPFAFRIDAMLAPDAEAARHVLTPRTLTSQFGQSPPGAILIGGEGQWTSGSDTLNAPLEDWARMAGWRQVPIDSERFRLWVPLAALR